MRVIAGKAKRLTLKTIDGLETRPTTDRIKETLFNMINQELADCDFLDLFSGSGAIGIEALSRGARSAVFIENSKAALDCIKLNLHNTGLLAGAMVLALDVISSIRTLELQGRVFDIIFMDPPYNQGLEQKVLNALEHSSIVYRNTIIIVEASMDTSFDYLDKSRFQIYREKEYKTNKHVFIELK
ncbi:16S rRNA (guanine(966)-N(2))-methyltransferase RsmD [Anaerocolumna sp. AGMB13025]|uniref:16S rRNA (guanine(966)-N(2))-methyltransferase RsmD n=1 Tax=Anaerocolumna sp. AGMB13025 TaxID=3039116 RepID=UPI00241E173E|nr:16S rRNA (guanine(966)-N(2))-methyltransferase RsmD [Anaerocolumna sp. AGMB13025]WFR59856.1 16S rRNA (guanine(966)-N(2))-methyltransferase RsmD [Anaerocolumna sp. AGMB13025]